mmetsp:Transcript_8105/g.24095  ORF Transcript_8105/g.24095 Transcript_8105/m.24095 type:complete len:262 (-) Transcript_8105:290-1075(-)
MTNHMYYNELCNNGYTILKNVMSKEACDNFLSDIIMPVLERHGVVDGCIEQSEEYKAWDDDTGAVITGTDNGHPIPLHQDKWPYFFESPVLNSFLDHAHGGSNWEWTDGAKFGMGWVHLRYPVGDTGEWEPPDEYNGWHIDGGTDRQFTSKSLVMLPFLTDVGNGGGGTAVLPGSHNAMMGFMYNKSPEKVESKLPKFIEQTVRWAHHPNKSYLNNMCVTEATGTAGDVLIMHPLLIHCGSVNLEGNPTRVTFNMSTGWKR